MALVGVPIWGNAVVIAVERAALGVSPVRRVRVAALWLPLVCLVGVVVRLPDLAFGLPELNHPDEPVNMAVGIAMVDHGTIDPHYFNYPSLLFDVIALITWMQRTLTGHPSAGGGSVIKATTGIGYTSDPHLFLALRLVSLALSVGTCVLVYFALRRITGVRWIAALPALALAVSPLMVSNGVFITPDVYSLFFTTAALVGALAIARRFRVSDYVWTGIAVGLAVGSKFDLPVVVAVVVAHVVQHGRRLVGQRQLLAVLWFVVFMVAAFVVTSPAVLFDTHDFVNGMWWELHHYASGHPGQDGGSSAFYLSTVVGDVPVLLVGAWIAVLALAVRRYRGEFAVVGLYAVGYVVLICTQVVHFDRNVLPLYPALAILFGLGVDTGVAVLRCRCRAGFVVPVASVLLAVVLLVSPLLGSVRLPTALDDAARTDAWGWLVAHIRAGSTVVDESYGPYLGVTNFHVTYLVFATLEPVPPNPSAIVLTEQGSGRYSDANQFPVEHAALTALTNRYCTAATFTSGPWVKILVPCR